MVVQGLYGFIVQRTKFQSGSISSLKDSRIGVDGHMWLKSISHQNVSRSRVAYGGLPLTFENIVRSELAKFQDCKITPVFVFNGIECSPTFTSNRVKYQRDVKSLQQRMYVWNQYHQKFKSEKSSELNTAFDEFERNKIFSRDFLQSLFKLFDENKVEYIVAPYLAWGQLSYLLRMGLVNAVYGGNELLLFPGVKTFITTLKLERGQFNFLEKEFVLKEITKCSESQFVEACIIGGCFLSETYKGIVKMVEKPNGAKMSFDSVTKEQSFAIALNAVKQHGGGYSAITNLDMALGNPHKGYKQLFHQVKLLLKNHVIFEQECKASTQEFPIKVPGDFEKVIGRKLHDKLYYLLSIGAVSRELVTALEKRELFQKMPLVDTEVYRTSLKYLLKHRTFALKFLYSAIGKDLEDCEVRYVCLDTDLPLMKEFDEPKILAIKQVDIDKVTNCIDLTQFSGNDSEEDVSFEQIIRKVVKSGVKVCKEGDVEEKRKFKSLTDIKANVMSKFLELVGIIKKKTAKKVPGNTNYLSGLGKCLSLAVDYRDYKIEVPLLALVLIQNEILKGKPFARSLDFKDTPDVQYKDVDSYPGLLLISRAMALLPCEINEDEYLSFWETGRIHQDLTAFQSIVETFYTVYRELLMSIFSYQFVNQGECFHEENFANCNIKGHIVNDFPFFQEGNCIMGIIFRTILKEDYQKGVDINVVEKQFGRIIKNPKKQITSALRYWTLLVKMVKKGSFKKTVVGEFEKADVAIKRHPLLKQFLKQK